MGSDAGLVSDYSDTDDVMPPAKRIRRQSSTPRPTANGRVERVTEVLPPQPQDDDDEHEATNCIDVGEWEDVCLEIKMCKCHM